MHRHPAPVRLERNDTRPGPRYHGMGGVAAMMADASRGVVARGALAPARFDLVVLGAGPAGTTVAALAAQRGARVLVLEARALGSGSRDWGNRWRMATVRGDALQVLERVDVERSLLSDARSVFEFEHDRYAIVPIGAAERAIHSTAEGAGAEFRFGVEVLPSMFRQLDGGDIELRLQGSADVVRGTTLIDATGGRSGIAAHLGIPLTSLKRGPMQFLLGHYPVQPLSGHDANAPPFRSLSGRDARFGSYGGVMLNHPQLGAHVDFFEPPIRDPEDLDELTFLHRRLSVDAGVVGEPLRPPELITVDQAVAPSARVGDYVVIGDGLSRALPTTASGFREALLGAEHVVGPALDTSAARDQVLAAFSERRLRAQRIPLGLWVS